MKLMKFSIITALFLMAPVMAGTALGEKGNLGNKHRALQKTGQTIEPSGLTPNFNPDADCTGIASTFGATTRYDGSRRPKFRYNGRHGGIDLTLAPGTPLLAIASGTLVHKARGGQMEGIHLWLLHSPEDTGYPNYVLTKYQHLNAMPTLNIGTRVAVGQVIGYSGATGTHGGHYGSKGYPHLHLSTMHGSAGKFMIKNNQLKTKAALFDPLTLFKTAPNQTSVAIPYKDCSGTIHPKGAQLVWPVICYPKLPE